MQWLAGFIMRSRSTAALIAATAGVLFWLFPPLLVIAGAAIALVTLRRGPAEGALAMLLGGLGAIGAAWLAFNAPWPILRVLLLCWPPVWLLALVLRSTISLSRTFQAAALLGILGVAGFYLILGDPTLWWNQILDQLRQELIGATPSQPASDHATLEQVLILLKDWAPYLAGQVIGAALIFIISALLLGRWWQSLLFNRGGFGPEFQALHLGQVLALFTLALFGLTVVSGWAPLANVVLVLGILYTVQGIALVHAVLNKLQLSPTWLILFYLLLIPLLSQVVMALGIVDAWADFRNRIRPRSDKR